MLEVVNLSTRLLLENQTWLHAVDDISFSVDNGEVFALIGESGCGKSMTALSIMRLLPPNARYVANSQIHLHGKNIIDLPEQQMRSVRGGDIAMIFQDPMTCLNPVMTVGKQITEVLQAHQDSHGREAYVEALQLLDAVRIPAVVDRFNAYPHELSGGMKQRIMIAMALASKPSLLIADEPTTALDVTTQAQILSLLRELQRQQNMAVLLITHDLAVASQMADRIAVMQAGKIIEQSSAQKLFSSPQQSYTQKLLAACPSFSKQPYKQLLAQENILTVNDLRVHFPVRKGLLRKTVGYLKAVDGVDFTLAAGETLAVVGESGCGKTTIAKALLALQDEKATGAVMFAGQNLLELSQKKWRALRADLQIIFQDPFAALNPKLRVIDSLEEGLLLLVGTSKREDRLAKIDKLLTQVGLTTEHKWRYPHELSGGERQRVCIARALTVEPKIIICDEPTSSLDVSVQAQVLNLLQSLQTEHNLTYLFISHDLAVVSVLAHRVAVMYLGRIVEAGLTTEVLGNPKHPYTQALLAAVPSVGQGKPQVTSVVAGEIPSPLKPPSGCHFHPRCKFAKPQCRKEYPQQVSLSTTRTVRCVLYNT